MEGLLELERGGLLNKVVRAGLPEKVEGGEGRAYQAAGTAYTKALRQEECLLCLGNMKGAMVTEIEGGREESGRK